MRTIAHIINPFIAKKSSDLHLAQQVTIHSMEVAQKTAVGSLSIDLMTAQFSEDKSMVPSGWIGTQDLTRSIKDKGNFERDMKLPFLTDILERMFNETKAEYLIFTNVDIGVQPEFYLKVNEMIDEGRDAFIINRRRIPENFSSVDEMESIYAEKGKKHPGFDCFIFHRDLFQKFSLADVCTGVPFIGITLAQNVFCFGNNPKVYRDEFLTFHIGMEIFKKRASRDYFKYNRREFWTAMDKIWNDLDSKKWPQGSWILPLRLLWWGKNPSLPIRLGLMLEYRRWIKR
ncbi:MAG: hypothetical protein ACI9FU_000659 [Granulosicoccus sp.]|jgi:hypothetical protein